MKAWMSSDFGQIPPPTTELSALVRLNKIDVKCCEHSSASIFDRIFFILMALSLLYAYICYYPIATFQKAGTCLDAQQSMAKQPIKGCVSNQNRTCGKSVSEKSE